MSTFLTLGDGDFTYSLDLAQYLLAQEGKTSPKKITFIATGIDSPDELKRKYTDSEFTLRKLKRLNCTSKHPEDQFRVMVFHSINAISEEGTRADNCDFPLANHVIFNFPHLGTEDAKLHSSFLCHLFYSVSNAWMTDDKEGSFHLALAHGQFERWRCSEAAERHGFVLLSRARFRPPPLPSGAKTHYQSRRHHTGKSFATRTTGPSEIFTFRRRNTKDNNTTQTSCMPSQSSLPGWYRPGNHVVSSDSLANESRNPTSDDRAKASNSSVDTSAFACSHCGRGFREQRSLMNHFRYKHSNKRPKTANPMTCRLCPDRHFDTEQALQAHIEAKHQALHTTILPDWCKTKHTGSEMIQPLTDDVEVCSICGHTMSTGLQEHMQLFVPKSEPKQWFHCTFCSKAFHQNRAKLQHENRCLQKPTR